MEFTNPFVPIILDFVITFQLDPNYSQYIVFLDNRCLLNKLVKLNKLEKKIFFFILKNLLSNPPFTNTIPSTLGKSFLPCLNNKLILLVLGLYLNIYLYIYKF